MNICSECGGRDAYCSECGLDSYDWDGEGPIFVPSANGEQSDGDRDE